VSAILHDWFLGILHHWDQNHDQLQSKDHAIEATMQHVYPKVRQKTSFPKRLVFFPKVIQKTSFSKLSLLRYCFQTSGVPSEN
jgi:hypothetical protein